MPSSSYSVIGLLPYEIGSPLFWQKENVVFVGEAFRLDAFRQNFFNAESRSHINLALAIFMEC